MKILIATATAGGGHLQAAAALEEAWKDLRPKDQVRRVDVLDFTSKLYRKTYAEGYVRISEKWPELYSHAFRKTDSAALVRKMTKFRRWSARLVARRFVRFVDDWKPDVVVCPHFLAMEALGSVRGHADHHQPKIVTVVTDFEAHALWMEPSVDLYCVAMPETKARLVARGIPERQVIATGIPVSKRFLKIANKGSIRRHLRLHPSTPLLLVVGGGMGMGPLVETVQMLDRTSEKIQMAVVCGRNEKLKRTFLRKRFRHPVRVLGFVDNMEEWMSAADFLVTKPGGLTSSEALALGKPLLIVNPLPGQEAANSDFLLERGAAAKVNRLEDLPYRAGAMLKKGRLSAMARAARALGKPKAAQHICRAVVSAFGLFLLFVNLGFAQCPVAKDEEIFFMPSVASLAEDGKTWNASIQGWVYEPESNSLAHRTLLAAMRKGLGLSESEASAAVFQERARYFLVDNERGKRPVLQDGHSRFPFSPSDASGDVSGAMSFAGSEPGWARLSTVACESDPRLFYVEVQKIPFAGLSVISDIDDTIKQSNVLNRKELLANTFLRPYVAVEGMPALYQQWEKQGAVFHYLSASPRPLAPALLRFLEEFRFPKGSLHIKPFRPKSRDAWKAWDSPQTYKTERIESLLKRFPGRRFVLVGDSGERDPEIYGQITRRFGAQIQRIVIREIAGAAMTPERINVAFEGISDRRWIVFQTPSSALNAVQRDNEEMHEVAQVLRYRQGLQEVLAFTASRADLFPQARLPKTRFLTREEKEIVWSTWKSFMEYMLGLESLRQTSTSFNVRYAAFLAEYRYALDLIALLDHDPSFDILLNEPVAELGLKEGSYRQLKYRFLHIARAADFTAFAAIYRTQKSLPAASLETAIKEDVSPIWNAASGRGPALTLKNAWTIVQTAGATTWLPIQTGVSEWMGDTRVYRQNQALINETQIGEIRKILQPGDILLQRREWFLSNIGLPGFWPHAAVYVGTPEERRVYFGRSFEKELQKKEPDNYANSLKSYEGHIPSVLEAISEGVTFTSAEHSLAADSLAILRPRLSKEERAKAVLRAFHFAGRPYDFNFDFATDAALVCSEVVFKAYEPAQDYKGIRFDLAQMLGRSVTPPNLMVQQFDRDFGTPQQQLDLVLFLDGREWMRKAVPSDVETFRQSWKRPKWHIWMQEKEAI